MRWFVLAEIGIGILILIFFVSQVLVPLCYGRPFFPLLRKKRIDAETQLASAREDADIAAKRRLADRIRDLTRRP